MKPGGKVSIQVTDRRTVTSPAERQRERDRERKKERDRKREIERRGREERSGAVWSSAVGTAWSGGEGGWRWVLHLPVTVLLCHAAPVRKGADVQ